MRNEKKFKDFKVGCITVMIVSIGMLYGAFYIYDRWDEWWTTPTFIMMLLSVAILWIVCPLCWIVEHARQQR
ncbi:MAG: hypothetical protein GF411_14380 [Candidatus Lokiarchaeota archaeon]|nr:hypothetical protein [Candidatus Lokiarchaeota archaeon]